MQAKLLLDNACPLTHNLCVSGYASLMDILCQKHRAKGAHPMSQKAVVPSRVQKALTSVDTFWPGRLDAVQKEQLSALRKPDATPTR